LREQLLGNFEVFAAVQNIIEVQEAAGAQGMRDRLIEAGNLDEFVEPLTFGSLVNPPRYSESVRSRDGCRLRNRRMPDAARDSAGRRDRVARGICNRALLVAASVRLPGEFAIVRGPASATLG
jgi:hypothetical protein